MLYQIHRYPAELIDVVHLGGSRVVIRPVLPQDAELTGRFFRNLSAPARYARFLAPTRELPGGLLQRLTEIDYAGHVALVAVVLEGAEETLIGEARYVLAGEKVAEFAVAVADRWQGRGLASRMLARLACKAAASGVRHLRGETLAGNAAMLHLARKAGFTATPLLGSPGVVQLQRTLEPSSGGPCIGAGSASLAA